MAKDKDASSKVVTLASSNATPVPPSPFMKISDDVLMHAARKPARDPSAMRRTAEANAAPVNAFQLPEFPAPMMAAVPKKHHMAMDEFIVGNNAWAQSVMATAWGEGLQFLGYPYLAELAQRPEYRVMIEILAQEMTRKWIRFQAVNTTKGKKGPDKTDKIKKLNDALDKFKVRDVMRRALEIDNTFGRSHIFLDFGEKQREELTKPIGNGRERFSKSKVKQGSLKRITTVEPMWVYPTNYNAINPLAPDWYKPTQWFVMDKPIHCSRLLTISARIVPDLLKPAYAFGGLSMSQMAKPYVDNWLNTRQSVADIVQAFSVMVLKTNLAATLGLGGDALDRRVNLFNNLRNNRGVMMLDKETEDFANISAPIAGLEGLQAQTQEHMSSVSRIPLVKLLGITPAGLNTNTDGETETFDDTINAAQENVMREPLTTIIDFIQLNEFGEVDQDITFIFEPLTAATPKELAEIDKLEAETDDIRVAQGALGPEEVRKRVIGNPNSPYADEDPEDVPDLQEEEQEGLLPGGHGVKNTETEAGAEPDNDNAPPKAKAANDIAMDAALLGEIEFTLDRPTTSNRNLRTTLNTLIRKAAQAGLAQDEAKLTRKLRGHYLAVAKEAPAGSVRAKNARAKAKELAS